MNSAYVFDDLKYFSEKYALGLNRIFLEDYRELGGKLNLNSGIIAINCTVIEKEKRLQINDFKMMSSHEADLYNKTFNLYPAQQKILNLDLPDEEFECRASDLLIFGETRMSLSLAIQSELHNYITALLAEKRAEKPTYLHINCADKHNPPCSDGTRVVPNNNYSFMFEFVECKGEDNKEFENNVFFKKA